MNAEFRLVDESDSDIEYLYPRISNPDIDHLYPNPEDNDYPRISNTRQEDTSVSLPERPTNVLTLKEISSVTVAIAIWNHVNIPKSLSTRHRFVKDSNEWHSFRRKVCGLVRKLQVPFLLQEYVGWYVDKMEKEIHNWVSYHLRTVFFQNGNDYPLYYLVYDMVWYLDGTIDCKRTAINLLPSVRLSDMEKFRFLCMYCLKDDMEDMSPALFLDHIKDYVTFDEYPLICYWSDYFRNELCQMSSPFRKTLPQNSVMVQHKKVDNWTSKEYFFDCLNMDERVKCAKTLITKHGLKYQKLVLMKLYEIERTRLYMDHGVRVMSNYAGASNNFLDEILSTWMEMRNLITQGQFAIIFKKFLDTNTADEILTNVWIEAPSDFKRYILNYKNHEIIEKTFIYWKSRVGDEFIFDMLSDTEASVKKQITEKKYFDDFCQEILKLKKIPILDRLLHLCFPKPHEFVCFKQNLVLNSEAVKQICEDYYQNGKLEELNNFLSSLMPFKSKAVLQYKKNILMSENGIEKCASHLYSFSRERDILREIIADGLPTEDLATKFRNKLIFSSSAINSLQRKMKEDRMDDVKKSIDIYLKSKEDKRKLKKRLIDDVQLIRELLIKNSANWESVVQWCLEDNEAIEEFKMTLPVDKVFDEVLKYCVFRKYDVAHRISWCTFIRDPVFDPVNVFLKWYFTSAGKINQYKLRRIDSWMDIEMIATLMKKKDERYLKTVMSWFFGNHKKQIVSFKKKFAGEKIASMV